MSNMYFLIFVASLPPLTLNEITILVLSQENKYHREHAEELRSDILQQSLDLVRIHLFLFAL